MNRIILIGNGFDLAHGMPTSYSDFLKDYWTKTIEEIKKGSINNSYENEEFKISKLPSSWISGNSYSDLVLNLELSKSEIEYKNRFLKEITEKSHLQNWVDIENEYYSLLKKSYDHLSNIHDPYKIEDLNKDLTQIKLLLKEYLTKIEKDFDNKLKINNIRLKRNISRKIYSIIKYRDFSEETINRKIDEEYEYLKEDLKALINHDVSIDNLNEKNQRIFRRIDTSKPKKSIRELLLSENAFEFFNYEFIPDQTLFLNFNYTSTELLYNNPVSYIDREKSTNPIFNHIHGTIDQNDNNPMIFGFGDEIDDDYKFIEKLNNNNYLKNIKSINYLESDNYKRLLEFISSNFYQIFIFGHSCGISDRTLLNTLFEHNNCSSIKVFYHQITEKSDNYLDVVRNISRNFNNKVILRDRIVNKTFCEPLS